MNQLKLLLLISTLLLSGCVAPHFKPEISKNDLSNGGVVFFSTAAIEKCTVHNVYLAIKPLSESQGINNAKAQFLVTNRYVGKDFPESNGLLQVISLPAGQYNFWFEQRHPMLDVEYDDVIPPFKIETGETKYLGEIEVDGCLDISVKINNEFERDSRKFNLLYPQIDKVPITMDILSTIK